jgi:hypothetical protein
VTGDEGPVELVGSVGDLDAVVALLRDFLHRTGALRAVAVVERAPGEPPAVVDCGRLQPIEVDLGERTVALPHAIELDAEPPALPPMRQLPPFEVDEASGEVRSILGGLHHAVECVTALADALGGRNVALAQFPTLPVEQPLSITARAGSGEAPVVALGDTAFDLPEEAQD